MIAQQMVTEAVSGSWMRGTIRGKNVAEGEGPPATKRLFTVLYNFAQENS